jgi:hypothetical protein
MERDLPISPSGQLRHYLQRTILLLVSEENLLQKLLAAARFQVLFSLSRIHPTLTLLSVDHSERSVGSGCPLSPTIVSTNSLLQIRSHPYINVVLYLTLNCIHDPDHPSP